MPNVSKINNAVIFDRNELFCVTRYQTVQIGVYFLWVYTFNCRETHFRQGFQSIKEVIYYIPRRICKALSFHGDDHSLLFLLRSKRI